MRSKRRQAGFTLLEVIIAVAIVAIMAGAIAPVAYHEINKARQSATLREMNNIKEALLDFYEDVGRFPDEADGLGALLSAGGAENWQGPYLDGSGRDPLLEINTDAFGSEYVYELDPRTSPAGAADLILVSPGINRHQELGDGGTFDLRDMGAQDDLLVSLSAGPLDRGKRRESLAELDALAEAARNHYRDRGSFPGRLEDLEGNYIDAGFERNAFLDGWHSQYHADLRTGSPAILALWSGGSDRQDDAGEEDDLYLEVSSAPLDAEGAGEEEEESETEREIREAQALIDADPALPLNGRWHGNNGIRAGLGLDESYDEDEWENRYRVNDDLRLLYSCGPDGRRQTSEDNLPAGVGP